MHTRKHTNRGVDALGVLFLLVSIRIVLRDVNGLAVGDALVLESVLSRQVVLLSRKLDAAALPLDEEGALLTEPTRTDA